MLGTVRYDQTIDAGWDECGTDSLAECLEDLGFRDNANLVGWLNEIHTFVHNDQFRAPGELTSVAQMADGITKFAASKNVVIQQQQLFNEQDVLAHVQASHQVCVMVNETDLEASQHYYHVLRVIGYENERYAYVDSYYRYSGSENQAVNGVVWCDATAFIKSIQDGPSGPWGIALWKDSKMTLPAGYTDDGTKLTYSDPATGQTYAVEHGNYGLYQNNPDAFFTHIGNLISDEEPRAILELANPKIGGGTLQFGTTGVIGYAPNADPASGITPNSSYYLWCGENLLATYHEIDRLNAVIAQENTVPDQLNATIAQLNAKLQTANSQLQTVTQQLTDATNRLAQIAQNAQDGTHNQAEQQTLIADLQGQLQAAQVKFQQATATLAVDDSRLQQDIATITALKQEVSDLQLQLTGKKQDATQTVLQKVLSFLNTLVKG